jgi:hypothetical protein
MTANETIYIKKLFWPASTTMCCGHCGGPIKYRPYTLGVGEAYSGHGIKTYGYFCAWPCARAVGYDPSVANSTVEVLTTSIMMDFKMSNDLGDDPDGFVFLQRYSRFSEIPSAPSRMSFIRYGGNIADDEYRAMWAGKTKEKEQTYGDLLSNKAMPSEKANLLPMSSIIGSSITVPTDYYGDQNTKKLLGFSSRKPQGARRYQYSTGSSL